MALSTTSVIPSEHSDVVLDVAYNYYGNRMATASADHTVCIWDLQDDGKWKKVASITTNAGAVWKVNWAHPDFGQVIATCSFDKVVSIWEELPEQRGIQHTGHIWAKRTQLVDAKTPVIDVRFAPKHLGLMLAAASTDGVLRVYEAADAPNVRHMSVFDSQQVSGRLSCLAWSTSMLLAPLLAAGMAELNPTAASTASGFYVVLFLYTQDNRRLIRLQNVACPIYEPVNDLDFAPSLGRNYHVLGVGGKSLTILNIAPITSHSSTGSDQPGQASAALLPFDVVPCPLRGGRENALVWCVSWNATGTILATSHDDGTVCLWKCDHLGGWQCISGRTSDN